MTRVVCIADTHQELPKYLPKGDILIHAGDACDPDKLDEYFGKLISTGYYRHIIFVPGNHDFVFTQDITLGNAFVLINGELRLAGLHFWGSPYTPLFHNWAFMKTDWDLKGIWNKIPEGLDFLITHGPPNGILDKNIEGEGVGSESLFRTLHNIKAPKYHIFGHIHEAYGQMAGPVTKINYINCSLLNEKYELVNDPVVIDL